MSKSMAVMNWPNASRARTRPGRATGRAGVSFTVFFPPWNGAWDAASLETGQRSVCVVPRIRGRRHFLVPREHRCVCPGRTPRRAFAGVDLRRPSTPNAFAERSSAAGTSVRRPCPVDCSSAPVAGTGVLLGEPGSFPAEALAQGAALRPLGDQAALAQLRGDEPGEVDEGARVGDVGEVEAVDVGFFHPPLQLV